MINLGPVCYQDGLPDGCRLCMMLAESLPVLAQGRSPEFILQIMECADRLRLPKTLACCERHVAIDSANNMRTKVFWERIPICSSIMVRIAKGLECAYESVTAHYLSKIDSVSNTDYHTDYLRYMREWVCDLRMSTQIKLRFVPSCMAFLRMTEPVLSQAEAISSE